LGALTYDGTHVEFDDRLLTHLEIVIINKFRRGESFLMSWKDGVAVGSGRAAIWLAPNIPIYFKFYGSRVPKINRDWIARLGETADGPQGLLVIAEDGALAESTPSGGRAV
jgi:hypothetical protein